MLIGIGKDLLVHVRQHSWQSSLVSPEGMVCMALFLVLFNRCRVPLFPVRESPSALSGRARILMSGWLFKRHLFSLYPLHLHLFESLDPFFWIFISPRCKASSIQ